MINSNFIYTTELNKNIIVHIRNSIRYLQLFEQHFHISHQPSPFYANLVHFYTVHSNRL